MYVYYGLWARKYICVIFKPKPMRFLLLFSILLILNSCQQEPEKLIPIKVCPNVDLQEGNVIGLIEYDIIKEFYEASFGTFSTPHIEQTSKIAEKYDFESLVVCLEKESVDIDSIIVKNYVDKNESSFVWGFSSEHEIPFISSNELDCLFLDNEFGWESYRAKYEDSWGFVSVGRPVVFNNNTSAIFMFCNNFGVKCSSENIAIMEKEGNKWMLKQTITISSI